MMHKPQQAKERLSTQRSEVRWAAHFVGAEPQLADRPSRHHARQVRRGRPLVQGLLVHLQHGPCLFGYALLLVHEQRSGADAWRRCKGLMVVSRKACL